MTESKPKTVLDEELFPIMGWPGPSGDLIRDDVMRDMAEAGFTSVTLTQAPISVWKP